MLADVSIAEPLLALHVERGRIFASEGEAGELFGSADLPLYPGAERTQSPDEYLDLLAATAGMPVVMGRANMEKITHVLSGIEGVLDGLTRGLDLSVLDGGWGTQDGRRLSYQRLTDTLGAILPNNSPGVHNLWVPALPLKIKLVLRPGGSEPWTPYRLVTALIEAGAPPEAFSLYPSSHSAVPELLTIGTTHEPITFHGQEDQS